MHKNRWMVLVVAVIILAAVGFWLAGRRKQPATAVNLLDQFAGATKRPAAGAFEVTDVTIDGQTKRVIFTHPTSRITWRVTVPDDAWLRTALALKPEAWQKEGDGVLFRIGVSDGRKYDELVNQHVDPFAVSGDRRWIPVTVDLSPYSGEQVDVIFNTNTSQPNKGDDSRNDLALWGAPQIYVSR